LLGENLRGDPIWFDIGKTPHLLVAGCTGSGKSSLLHTLITNLLYRHRLWLYLLDPKNTEYHRYADHANVKVLPTYQDALDIMTMLLEYMEDRYAQMRAHGWATKDFDPIVVIVDEFADLIMQDAGLVLMQTICRLAQKCRAANIYLVLATQRPSVDVITGSIKANFPARLCCRVASKIDSRIVLDANGAEKLLGNGDALITAGDYSMERFQVAWSQEAP
jgi:S-DNA-T family DNA segregation ATPase FtsK/SpoIIIE